MNITNETLETLASALRRTYHNESAIQHALVSVWLHSPADPLSYARRVLRASRAASSRKWARARQHRAEMLPLIERTIGPAQLDALLAGEQLEAVGQAVPSLWAQGWELTDTQRFRLRARGKSPVQLTLDEGVEELWDTLRL